MLRSTLGFGANPGPRRLELPASSLALGGDPGSHVHAAHPDYLRDDDGSAGLRHVAISITPPPHTSPGKRCGARGSRS